MAVLDPCFVTARCQSATSSQWTGSGMLRGCSAGCRGSFDKTPPCTDCTQNKGRCSPIRLLAATSSSASQLNFCRSGWAVGSSALITLRGGQQTWPYCTRCDPSVLLRDPSAPSLPTNQHKQRRLTMTANEASRQSDGRQPDDRQPNQQPDRQPEPEPEQQSPRSQEVLSEEAGILPAHHWTAHISHVGSRGRGRQSHHRLMFGRTRAQTPAVTTTTTTGTRRLATTTPTQRPLSPPPF